MAVLVPIDGDGDGEGEGGRAKAVTDPAPAPVPAPMDIDGDRGALDVLAPRPHGHGPRPRPRPRPGRIRRRSGARRLHQQRGPGGAAATSTISPRTSSPSFCAASWTPAPPPGPALLSRRWRHVWKWVSGLFLHHYQPHDSSIVRAALAAHAVHAVTNINKLYVVCLRSATPDATASWIRVAAPLISGELAFCNRASVPFHMLFDEVFSDPIEERGALELPCFTRATKIALRLGFLGLSLPPSGVFAALRELRLSFVRFHGELTLDDTVMPFLEGLEIYSARVLASLTLRLKHLNWMNLSAVRGLLRLNAVVPRLKFLTVSCCFCSSTWLVAMAGVCIVAEELQVLRWLDWYCPRLIKFSQMPRLYVLSVSPFYPYGRHRQHTKFNPSCDRLLKTFSRIRCLEMLVFIEPDQDVCPPNCSCDRPPNWRDNKDISMRSLREVQMLNFRGKEHELDLLRVLVRDQDVCPPNCSCDRPPNWRDNKDISMRSLREVQMLNFRGKEHELDLLRVLVRVATGIRRIRITCHRSFAAWERLSAVIRSFARPETSVEVSQPSLFAATVN
ncbi:hypothetical protein OsJ_24657 [Oryza sativa Japonica Group]|uniref:FBD domain-containing protein n=1 Tax=Oryza sativa subsp. japonica TaxID=39947 RepID=B9FXS8_ORYSJ|nr:hypothetical protein OsJ_24657 [Oryza sativa Japonica Group]